MEQPVQGRGFQLIVLLLAAFLFYLAHKLIKSGRAAEMGRPIHYTYGAGGGLASSQGPQIVASSAILGYVAQLCARYDVRPIMNICIADAIPLTEEVLRVAYLREGKPEKFDPKIINYQPGQSPMVTAILGTFQRETTGSKFPHRWTIL